MNIYLTLFLLSVLSAYVMTPAAKALGQRLQAYGSPRDGRQTPEIPRLGGLAVFCSLLAVWRMSSLVSPAIRASFQVEWPALLRLLIPSIAVLALGALDDLRGVTPLQKLSVETAAASLLWCAGIRITAIPIFGYAIHSLVMSFLVTALWIVAVSNAFNMTDGLDGLATGIALIISVVLFVVAMIEGNVFVCILSATLCGALTGFLRFNFAPASIYLGDTGSLFLGFFLAGLTILITQYKSTQLTTVVPFVAFAFPLFEISVTVVRRFLTGRPLLSGDRNHFHHRVLAKRMSPRRAALVLYAMATLFSLGSLVVFRATGSRALLGAFLIGSAGWFLTSYLQYEEFPALILPRLPRWPFTRYLPTSPLQNHNFLKQTDEAGPLEVKHETSFSRP